VALTKSSEAKVNGFAQVREALQAFEGDCVKAEWGEWPVQTDDDGNPKPVREYLDLEFTNVVATEVTEDLTMDVTEKFSCRINASDYKNTFWVDYFLASADRLHLLIPDDLPGKRLALKKATWTNKKGTMSSVNFVLDRIIGTVEVATVAKVAVAPSAAVVNPTTVTNPVKVVSATPNVVAPVTAPVAPASDPMEVALEVAIGKTEAQFRTAISLNPAFVGSPLLSMAKAGAITMALVKDGKLVEVKEGNKTVYKRPE
jgi:hypothetical protein